MALIEEGGRRGGAFFISFDGDDVATDETTPAKARPDRTPPRRLQARLLHSKRRTAGLASPSSASSPAATSSPHASTEEESAVHVDWTSLPDEVLLSIFSYLDMWTLLQVSQTSRVWRRLSEDQYIGSVLDFSVFRARLQDAHFLRIIERINVPRVKTIYLHGCSSVTGLAIAKIPEKCSGLTSLILSGCAAVNNFALYCLLTNESDSDHKAPPNLVTSRARRRWHAVDLNKWTRGNWRSLPELHVLSLSYCSHVSDKAVEWILSCCPNLQELYLSGCARITDHTCALLSSFAKPTDTTVTVRPVCDFSSRPDRTPGDLRVLDLTSCFRVTLNGLALLAGIPSLRTLYAPPCLGKWDALTDAWLSNKSLIFDQLERLNLLGAVIKQELITETLAYRFPNLIAIDFSGSRFTAEEAEDDDDAPKRREEAWTSMLVIMPRLREINLCACGGLPRELLSALQLAFPHVRLMF